MALAEAMQLKPAKSKVHQVLDRSFLLVERYDRLIDTQGHRQRLHQEDFCQALGVVPEMKYQNEGGPDLAQCFDLVRSATRPSAPQVLRLLDYVIFAALLFYVLTTIGLFILRAKKPDVPRPYRAIGYPFLPALYIVLPAAVAIILLVADKTRPQALSGLAVVLIGVPVYFLTRHTVAPEASS